MNIFRNGFKVRVAREWIFWQIGLILLYDISRGQIITDVIVVIMFQTVVILLLAIAVLLPTVDLILVAVLLPAADNF